MRHSAPPLPLASCILVLCLAGVGPLFAQQSRTLTAGCETPPTAGDSPATLDAVRLQIEHGERCRAPALLDRALDRLASELFRRDGSAEAWYLAARAKFTLARLGAIARPRAHQVPGVSYAESAILALREALKRDPAYAPAAALLADAELRRLARIDGAAGGTDIESIRHASAAAPADTRLSLLRARRELEWGEPDSALAVTDRLLALHPVDGAAALVRMERARALLMLGRLSDGESAWFDGLASARSDSAVQAYRADLAWIATDAELAAFDSLDAAARPEWALTFWQRRAAADFRTTAERLAEHEQRIRFALAQFPLRSVARDFNKAMPYRSGQTLVEDRGVVYVRHGPPSRILRAGSESPGECPVYSWLYEDGPDRGMTVHFRPFFTLMRSERRFCAYADFKIVPGGIWVEDNAAQLAVYDSLYARWAGERRPITRQRLGRALVAEEVDRLTLAVTTDADPRRFAHDVHAVVRAYGLGHPGRLLVAFGVPPAGLGSMQWDGRAVHPLRLRLTALPRAGGAPLTVDTTFMYDAGRALRPDQWIVGLVELPAPAGEYEVRSLVTGAVADAGSFGLQLPVTVPTSTPGEPSVSALVLGTAASELRWTTPAGPFPLSPLNGYTRESDIEIFLAARELPTDAEVEARFRLAPVAGPGRAAVQLRFTQRAVGTTLLMRQSLGLAGVKPGMYVLTAELKLPDGRIVAQSQRVGVGEGK